MAMSLGRAVATVGGLTAVSRVLGFARDVLIAAILGAGPVADAFFVAFKLPNFFRRLFGEGAFASAFVPLYARRLEERGADAARGFAGNSLALLTLSQIAFALAAILAMPLLMRLLAPGFVGDPLRFDLAVDLTRMTFPYLMLMALAALMSGMLNAHERFAAAAATPILLNLAMMAAVVWLPPLVPTVGHALAWGVIGAGVAQFVWLAVATSRAGLALSMPWPRLDPDARRLGGLMLPAALSAGIVQVNVMVDVILASLLPAGAVSFLYYADRVAQLPLGIVGTAIGTALLPLMVRRLRAGDAAGARDAQARAGEMALLWTLPAAFALVPLSRPIIVTLFERGAFGRIEALATADALAAFTVGLPAFVLIKVLTPAYFAREDTRTPLRIAIGALVVNLLFNLILIGPLQHVGIALSTALAGWFNLLALAWPLAQRGDLAIDARLRRRAPRIALAALVTALAVVGLDRALDPLGDPDAWGRSGRLALIILAGLIVYPAAAQAFGAVDWRDALATLRRRPVDGDRASGQTPAP